MLFGEQYFKVAISLEMLSNIDLIFGLSAVRVRRILELKNPWSTLMLPGKAHGGHFMGQGEILWKIETNQSNLFFIQILVQSEL